MFSALLKSDYYGGSVALDLSVCRQSRVPSVMHVLASVRLPTHPFVHPRWMLFHDMKVLQFTMVTEAYHDIGVKRFSDRRKTTPSQD